MAKKVDSINAKKKLTGREEALMQIIRDALESEMKSAQKIIALQQECAALRTIMTSIMVGWGVSVAVLITIILVK